ncbi:MULTISPECIES: hypothetical protein [Paenibacillus]|uniref:Uncharacterized protein n=2 Tax=Paenibacillus TaxID=44249 RepID=A0A1V4HB83_9BACL|nr:MULTISPECIES: hypothetical protein [Paenibacillus]MEC0230753.1 hypothetical protein [Paenibacillus alba]NQX65144.1 hypothetical protein [Paenibacillus alba]OPH49301.1 hypothetical protein BC351_37580 [Paenibacillus ferrarius]
MSTLKSFTDSDQHISLELRDDHLTVLRLYGETSIYPFKNITLASEPIPEYPLNRVALTIIDFNTGVTDFKFSSSKTDFEIFVQNLLAAHNDFIPNH